MPDPGEARLIEKLRAIEALYARPGSAGERVAAGNARERILERLRELGEADPPIAYRFSMLDLWSRRVFLALLRRYGIEPYRRKGQRHTTVMARVSKRFVDETLWPEFEALSSSLRAHLDEVTDRVVAQVIHADLSEAAVMEEPRQLSVDTEAETVAAAPTSRARAPTREQSRSRSPSKFSTDIREPIGAEEWSELEALFARRGGHSLQTICGALNAVATAPSKIAPDAWLRLVLGDPKDGGDFGTLFAQGLRLYNMIAEQLGHDAPLCPGPDNPAGIRDWCQGYALGQRLDARWLLDAEARALAAPICALADAADKDLLGTELEELVLRAYHGLADARAVRADAPIPDPVRRGAKVGRNQPCPCGSGKKYKKCCVRARP